jgi:3-oxoacyl-[acyl-carrier-protein] synthase-3
MDHDFRAADGTRYAKSNGEIIKQFEAITGIYERRYAPDDLVTSDIAYEAAKEALDSSRIDPETLDCIIVAHNFGDVRFGSGRSDLVPSLASRVKAKLRIQTPQTAAFDLIFGCPGWIQGIITADAMIRAGNARRVMVIGAEILSRVSDPHDRDSMIYADGAGAAILELYDGTAAVGILSHAVRSDTLNHSGMLVMGESNNKEAFLESLFLKMEGHKLYRYVLETVAGAMKQCVEKAGIYISDLKKILLHQANAKMGEAIISAFYKLYGIEQPPGAIMPTTISWLGNSSVATVPTLLDLIMKHRLDDHVLATGDLALFASVGAGMNVNAFVYRVP